MSQTPTQIQALINQVTAGASFPASKMRPVLTGLNSFYAQSDTNPSNSNDSLSGFYAFKAFWLNTSTGSLFLCTNDTPGSAEWFEVTKPVNTGASVLNITLSELNEAISSESINQATQYRITDSSNGVVRVWGISTTSVSTASFVEQNDDPVVSGEFGFYDPSTDTFTALTSSAPLFYSATSNPGVNEDSDAGYIAGSIGINTSTSRVFICSNPSIGAAVWNLVSQDSGFESIAMTEGGEVQLADVTSSFLLTGSVSEFSLRMPANAYPGKVIQGRITGSASSELALLNPGGASFFGDTGVTGDCFVIFFETPTSCVLIGFSRLP